MLVSSRSQQKLYDLAVAIDAAAARDPYPRLAEFMRNVEYREARDRFASHMVRRAFA
jgi:hypothetical protein